jgi:MFS family permease
MGQGVIWYTGQFYAQSFLENTVLLDFNESRYILLWAILFATPFFVIFGSWSDKVGRKWIMLAGMFLGIICYRPIYQNFLDRTNVAEFQKTELATQAEPVVKADLIAGTQDTLVVTKTFTTLKDGASYKMVTTDTVYADAAKPIGHGKTKYIDKKLSDNNFWMFVFLVFIQIIFVTMVYGPIAAFLVELFPTKIRYTSMSLPYHIGNGVFGGLVPFIATLIASFSGSTPLSGLWYPIGIATASLIIGAVYISNKIDENVND